MTALQRLQIYGFALLAVALVTAGARSLLDVFTLANFTMIYFLLVLIIAIRIGTGPAFVTAFASFMCINFFLVPPFYSLWVADPREVIDLCVFFIVAAIAGRLAANARQQTQEAQRRAREQEILYRLTRSFNQLTDREGVYDALTKVLKEDLGAEQVHIMPHATDNISSDSNIHFFAAGRGQSHLWNSARIL